MNNSGNKFLKVILGIITLLLCLLFIGLIIFDFEEIDNSVEAENISPKMVTKTVTTYTVTTTVTTTSTVMTLTAPTTTVTDVTSEIIPEDEEEPVEVFFEPVEEVEEYEEDYEEEVEYDYSYSGLTDEEYRMYVLAVYLESGNQSYECKEAVASVIMNRVNLEEFPDTVYSVLTQDGQFTIDFSCTDVPDSDCYLAVDNVLNYGSVLPSGVKYFFADYCTDSWLWSREVYTTIDNVVFAY